jgi:hypothetical protein
VDIFKNILNLNNLIPPRIVKENLLNLFPDARSLEWSNFKKYYEVIFYEKDTEKIARFSRKGDLIEYRINLRPESLVISLPKQILNSAKTEGEIMNCITVHSADKIYYEFIVRDRDLVRYLLLLNAAGEKISFEKL